MDEKTQNFYSENADRLTVKYDSCFDGISDYFSKAFDKGMTILDIGCGSGRDMRILHDQGFSADGVDPCTEFVEYANQHITGYGSTITKGELPDLTSVDKKYDGILCSAVLMHLPEEQLFDASFTIRNLLNKHGRLLLSIPLADKTINLDTHRDSDDRLFNGVTPEQLELLFERIGFRLLNRWDNPDSLGRKHRNWATMLFKLDSTNGSRPIDTIESILNKDKKVATYKLALFRALADIATTNHKLVAWQSDGRVKIPNQAIAEKWLEYYWPLVEKGITQTTGTPMAFRDQISKLVDHYKCLGGLSAFAVDYRSNKLSADALIIHKKLISKLKGTIWKQPVRYAGGGAPFSILQYDSSDKTVLLSSDIWKELSLMGSWIQDATILRWAELTARISKDKVKPSEVIDCLLTVPTLDRDVNDAKTFYNSLKDKICVWSDEKIINEYHLDHAIPFSLWKNNDLWNLLPADSRVNNDKSDKLPEREVVKNRKGCIVAYWSQIKEAFPVRFEYEARKIVGDEQYSIHNWENKLFSTFAESIELTAIQRGVDRWRPKNYSTARTYNHNTVRYRTQSSIETIAIPFYPDLKIACGSFRDGYSEYVSETIEVENRNGNLDPRKHFIVCASGDSMDGGMTPVCDGDFLLFEINEGGTISNQLFAVERRDEFGDTSYIFKRIEKDSPGQYRLVSTNPNYDDIPVDNDSMVPFARFLYKVEESNLPNETNYFCEVNNLSIL